jgi:hypothetical protein
MRRLPSIPLAVALAGFQAVAIVMAQAPEAPLIDADITRALPALRLDAAAHKRAADDAARREAQGQVADEARAAAVTEILSAKTDPLAWFKGKLRDFPVPSTAMYRPDCSRAVTGQDRTPTAVFTFGVEAPRTWKQILQATDQTAGAAERPRPSSGRVSAESLAQQTRSFYSSRKFRYRGEPAPFQWAFVARDEAIAVSVNGGNAYAALEGCRTLVFGPQVAIRAEETLFTGEQTTPRDTSSENRELREALKSAGLGDAEYEALKRKLLGAREDARNPSGLAVDTTRRPASPEQQAAEREVQALIAARKQNVEVYRRHQATLEPLLAAIAGQ